MPTDTFDLSTPYCLHCSSRSITITHIIDEHGDMNKCICDACGYIWWEDNDPPSMPGMGLFVSEVDALKEKVRMQEGMIETLLGLLEAMMLDTDKMEQEFDQLWGSRLEESMKEESDGK